MTMEPLFRQVLAHATATPGKTAVVSGDRVLSYAELAAAIRRRATALSERFRVGPGDRLAVAAVPTAEFVSVYLAVHSLGAACIPFEARASDQRIAGLVSRLAPAAVVGGQATTWHAEWQAGFDDLAEYASRRSLPSSDVSPDRTADILLTTGTTADAKAVMLSHRALATAARHINAVVGTGPDDVEVLALPLNHSFGLGRMRCLLSLGATLVLVPGFMDGTRLTEALAAHRSTGFATVPAGIAILLSDHGSRLSRFADQLRYLELGSSAMPIEHKRTLMELLPETRLCMHYGLTEASRSAYLSFHDDPDRLDSIGRPAPGVRMRVIDASGEPVDTGAIGQIEIAGGHLMAGYWNDPERTAEALHDGWLRTGDLGRSEAGGWYYLEARMDDVINVAGRKILPREIEQVLSSHPAVLDCACVGIPDPLGVSGEIISAWMVPRRAEAARPAHSELAGLLRQNLEPYKVPREFHWIESIPRTASGKISRQRLRELRVPARND